MLHCGSQVLKLVCANRVILVHLWWNKNKENQAFSRVYRISQEKETYCVRVVVEDSVDDRMGEIQSQKTAEIDRTLKEVEEFDKLSTLDAAALFG